MRLHDRAALTLAEALSLLLCAPLMVKAQPPDAFDPGARDDEHIAALTGDKGLSATVGRVVVHVPAGTMSNDQVQALAERLSRGFDALVSFTHSPRDWQRIPSTLAYYFHSDLFISHADPENNRLFIAFPRLQSGQAPVLHEAVHVLLYPTSAFIATHPELFAADVESSTWLGEGIASYVGNSVAEQTGIAEGDPLGGSGTLDEADSTCAKGLASPIGNEIVPFIGAPGEPSALSSRERRLQVAPLFYACAASFTRFLVAAIGIDAVVDSLPVLHSETYLAAAAGQSIDALRAAWRRDIGAD